MVHLSCREKNFLPEGKNPNPNPSHRNISEKGLNQGGLHLNVKGNQQFFYEFSGTFRMNITLSTNAVPTQGSTNNAEKSHMSTIVSGSPALYCRLIAALISVFKYQ